MTLAELFGTLFGVGFSYNIVLFLVGLGLLAAIVMFSHRFGAAEAILSAGVLGYGVYALNVDSLFIGGYALILVIIAVVTVAMFYNIISSK